MIRQETVTINGRTFIHTWSDSGKLIHGGDPEGDYSEAYDPAELGRTYTETDGDAEDDLTADEVMAELEAIL